MYSTPLETPDKPESRIRKTSIAVLRTLWTIVRLPVLAFLVVLEPIVCGALWLLATLGIVGALFYRFLVNDPRFPFWPAMGLSVGLALLVGLYYVLIRLLGGGQDERFCGAESVGAPLAECLYHPDLLPGKMRRSDPAPSEQRAQCHRPMPCTSRRITAPQHSHPTALISVPCATAVKSSSARSKSRQRPGTSER